ncbi:MAG: universal stress protein [Cytophagales bacterium]
MMKKLLVPIDFSDCSLNAVRYACSLSKLIKAQLYVVYVHTPEILVNATPVWQPYIDIMPLPQLVHDQMATVKAMITAQGIDATTYIKEGILDESVVELALTKHADMIVMGTEGNYFGFSSLWGNNTTSVIDEKKIPVLAIPKNYKGSFEKDAQIVFATDFKGLDFIPDFLIETVQTLNATLNVFYVTEPYRDEENKAFEKKNFEYVKEIFKHSEVTMNHSYRENLIHAVEDFTAKKHASMIVMIAHQRSFLSDIFHSSVTKQMALHTKVPFLAIPDEKVELNTSVSNSGFIG